MSKLPLWLAVSVLIITQQQSHAAESTLDSDNSNAATTKASIETPRKFNDSHAKMMIKLYKENPQIRAVLLEQARKNTADAMDNKQWSAEPRSAIALAPER